MLCLSGLKLVPLLMKVVGTVYTPKEKPIGTATGVKNYLYFLCMFCG